MSIHGAEVKVESLYGLKIGDTARYIGDESRHVKDIIGKEGPIVNIEPRGGQFHIKFDDVSYIVSFGRQDLLLIDGQPQKEEKFEGVLIDQEDLNSSQMRYYLNKYHNFKEGINYAVTDRDEIKEIFLENESYVKFMKDLITIEKTRQFLTDDNVKQFYETFRTNIYDGGAISVSFKISKWTFRTHVLGWSVQRYLAGFFGLDLFHEMGFSEIK